MIFKQIKLYKQFFVLKTSLFCLQNQAKFLMLVSEICYHVIIDGSLIVAYSMNYMVRCAIIMIMINKIEMMNCVGTSPQEYKRKLLSNHNSL